MKYLLTILAIFVLASCSSTETPTTEVNEDNITIETPMVEDTTITDEDMVEETPTIEVETTITDEDMVEETPTMEVETDIEVQ